MPFDDVSFSVIVLCFEVRTSFILLKVQLAVPVLLLIYILTVCINVLLVESAMRGSA